MIDRITAADRRRNPGATKGKIYKLISRLTGKVLGYGKTIEEMRRRERQIQYFKHQNG